MNPTECGLITATNPDIDSEARQCCVVCPRATARALLGKWHVTRCVAIFGSVGDALQARRFADEGYGTGWHPDRPRRPRASSASNATADNAPNVCSPPTGNDSSP
jgi:hypothetical protein